MKKIIIGVFIFSLAFTTGRILMATTQAHSLGTVDLSVKSQTAAQISVSTATAKGQLVYCSDCVGGGGTGTICISTGSTTSSQFVLSTGTVCK